MLHPSYTELMETINKRAEEEGTPVINSRYSIVIAAAKRARQLIAETTTDEEVQEAARKPLSIAVDELMSGDVKIVENDMFDDDDDDLIQPTVYGVTLENDDVEDMDYAEGDDDGYDDGLDEIMDDLDDEDEE